MSSKISNSHKYLQKYVTNYYNSENARKPEKPLNNVTNTFVVQQKEQKISDRIQ